MKRLVVLYLSADGRIPRKSWWLGALGLILAEWVVLFVAGFVMAIVEMGYFTAHDPQHAAALATASVLRESQWLALGVAAVFFVPSLQIGMKRRHDRRRSGADYLAFCLAGMFLNLLSALGQTATIQTASGMVPTAFGFSCLIYALFGVYMLVVLGFRRGTPGTNVYGPDPAAAPVSRPAWKPGATPGAVMTIARPAWRPTEIRSQNPILRYWHGGYPLGPSFWLVNVLVGMAVELGLPLAVYGIDPDDMIDPAPRFLLLAASGAALALITVWLRVGVWRSAQRRAAERHHLGPNAFWARLAQVAVLPPLLFDGLILYFIVVFAGVYYPIAFQGDPEMPDYTVSVLQDGKALSVVGGIKFGLAHDMEAALNDNPAITTLYLQSPGGRLGAAEQVAQLVAGRGLDTYVADHCESACTRIFVAGRKRLLQAGGRLGFHSGRTAAEVPSALLDEINQSFAAKYVAAGIDAAFMRRAEAVTPPDIWYPTNAELIAARVVTAVVPGPAVLSGAAPVATGAVPTLGPLPKNRRRAVPHTVPSIARRGIAKDRR